MSHLFAARIAACYDIKAEDGFALLRKDALMKTRGFLHSLFTLAVAGLIAGCSGANHGVVPSQNGTSPMDIMPKSVSPALIKPAPMAKTAILPASAMTMPRLKPDTAIQALGWTQLPGLASQVVAAADGSIWVLSDQPAGADKYIWHYAKNQWTNIAGLASQLAVTPQGYLYALNSGGGTYLYKNGSWTALGGGAQNITAAADGSTYVLSNGGSGPDRAIWHNVNGTWSQVAGAGVMLASSWDNRSSYTVPGGTMSPGGFYVINSLGNIYYKNPGGSYVTFPGAASSIAPSSYGGLYVLGYPQSSSGETIYYYDLDNAGWTALPGMAVSISEAGGHLYAVTSNGYVYMTNAQTVAGTALTNTNPKGYNSWGPYAIANAFQFPVQSGYDGMGQTIAIIIESMPASTDITTYLSYFNITRRGSIAQESVDNGNATDTAGESTLDLETIAGLAPGANVIVYTMPNLSGQSTIDAYNQVLSDGKANVVSMSYGGCEYAGINTTTGPLFAQMAAQGIAAVASSGDTGNECYNGGPYLVGANNPASDPSVIGVGGTQTGLPNAGGTVLGTALWNDCPTPLTSAQNCMGSGSVSGNATNGFAGYPLPAYQKGIAGEASTTLRNIPDIAMPANNDLGYQALFGGWISNGGTSWSAPQTAALIAEIYQYCGVNAIQNPANIFYSAWAQDGYADFLDVTTGNDSFMSTTPSYAGATGFDNISGIGSPKGMLIAQRICPNNRPTLVHPAMHATVALDNPAPAQARTLQNVVRPTDSADLGERNASSPTRVTFVLRATANLAQNEQMVISNLQSAGFTIVRTFSNHLVVDAQAPSSIVERYFNTRIDDFMQGEYGVRFANTQPDVLPASIAPYVSGVLTQNLILARAIPPHIRVLTPQQRLPGLQR